MPKSLAGAINLVFIAYPQKYENCSTLVDRGIVFTVSWELAYIIVGTLVVLDQAFKKTGFFITERRSASVR
jgi:hypothetical protein